jgi:hypothetical protein
LHTYRFLDWLPNISPHSLRKSLDEANEIGREIANQHRQLTAERLQPIYSVFNDNRHEQHTQVWHAAA